VHKIAYKKELGIVTARDEDSIPVEFEGIERLAAERMHKHSTFSPETSMVREAFLVKPTKEIVQHAEWPASAAFVIHIHSVVAAGISYVQECNAKCESN
jgi:hypothetical protein